MSPEERAEALEQARDLIAWLESNPDIPFDNIEVRYSVHGESDEAELAELASISAAAGIAITGTFGGAPQDGDHQYVRRGGRYEPVYYQAVAIPSEYMARHDALYSYRDCVEPETNKTVLATAA
ncbi:hypothetical protein [Glycomyces sp. NPDC048151]|uniref:hypothetical protein n=1 Tax=Glycomyces sp. NPDC048151 TaxID=3364002 RepID=UPI003719C46B